MEATSYVLGIDIGTGSTKAVAVSPAGEIMATAQKHYTPLSPKEGYSEQVPELIWQSFVTCVMEVVAKINKPPAMVCFSSAMHSLILMDENDQPLTNIITWADTRSADIAGKLKASLQGEFLYTDTGTPVHPMSPLCKIIWFRKNEPELFARTQRFISIKEYIWLRIFGEYSVDHSIASATGLFDINKLKWNDNALRVADISESQLSAPTPTAYVKSSVPEETAMLLTIPQNTLFMIGASDGCLANVGSFATETGTAALTIGTSGAIRINSDRPFTDYCDMLFNYLLDEKTFVCGGSVNNGGNVMQWLLGKFLTGDIQSADDYRQLFHLMEEIPAGSHGLIFLPYLWGERAPIWDAKTCGTFFGIKPHHTQACFSRATVEGVCYALNDVLSRIERIAPVHQLNVTGGFTRSQTWMQVLADVTGKTVCLMQTEDASAIGAAYFALKHTGRINDYASLKQNDPFFIQPNAAHHKTYKKLFSIYRKLYNGLRSTMHELYDLKIDMDRENTYM